MKQEILEKCIDKEVESIISTWQEDILALSNDLQISQKEIEKQVRLHIPLILSDMENSSNVPRMPDSMKKILYGRFSRFKEIHDSFLSKSGAFQLQNDESEIIDNGVYINGEKHFDIDFFPVKKKIGDLIENELHYLRVGRKDTFKMFGMFLRGFEYPICYMSFSLNDRYYKTYALEKALGTRLKAIEIIQLTRVYGFGNLPRNSISKLVSFCAKNIGQNGLKYIITAINPYIGFSGASMAASGFVPFALAPVAYIYDAEGHYTGRRINVSEIKKAKRSTPPNVLLVKSINRKAQKNVKKIDNVTQIPFEYFDRLLNNLREQLEKSWSDLTIYHKTPKTISDPISKGQCGVTTAYLSKTFALMGYDVAFCEGEVIFPDGTPPIQDHCWLKIKKYSDGTLFDYTNIIVDLTSDQTGFKESIICEQDQNLKEKSIFYVEKKEKDPFEIKNEDLKYRLDVLENEIDKANSNKRSSSSI